MKRRATTISIMEVLDRFSCEDNAVTWLEDVLWGGVPTCGHCGCTKEIGKAMSKAYAYWCGNCRKHFTVKTGTIMHASKLPVRKWIVAIYYILTARKGISSLQLSKEISVTQKSAWFMLHRIREACGGNADYMLSGIVEIDETSVSSKESKKLRAGRGNTGKQAVIGMRERGGRTRAKMIRNASVSKMGWVIGKSVQPGSTIYTDELAAYKHLRARYTHKAVKHSTKEFINEMAHANGIESVWAVLKRGYNGIYHNWSRKHMHRYINEFVFRLNEGNYQIDTIDRMNSLCAKMIGKRLTCCRCQ